MQVKRIGVFFTLIKKAFFVFLEYNGLKLSASLSYYTVFSAVPLLIIIMSLAGVFFGELAVEGKVYVQIRELVGSQTALQVQHIIQKIEFSSHGTAGSIIGFVILFFSASGVFSEIQDSINYIWSIKPGPRKRFLHIVIKKLLSFSLLIVMGFILLVSLFINAITALLSERLEGRFPDSTVRIFSFSYSKSFPADPSAGKMRLLVPCLRRYYLWVENMRLAFISAIRRLGQLMARSPLS